VHAKRKHAGFVLKDAGGTVALVHIQIYNEYFLGEAVVQQVIGSNSNIIKYTKTLASAGEGVVGTSGDIHGDSVLTGILGTAYGSFGDV
jgi:hypothetical protein